MRGTAQAGLYIYPAYKALDTRVELGISAQYWSELSHSGDFDDDEDDFDYVKYYLTYYLDENRRFGISWSYVDGEDPSGNQEDQEYTQFGLVVKTD